MTGGTFQPDPVEPLLRQLAAQVSGTEAFAFDVSDCSAGVRPRLICHIRQDGASQQAMEAARDAMIQLVEPCIRQRKDGMLTIDDATRSRIGTLYCLISLKYEQNDRQQPAGVVSIITRCLTEQEARARLSVVQGAPVISFATAKPDREKPKAAEAAPARKVGQGAKIIAGIFLLHGAAMLVLSVISIVQYHSPPLSIKVASAAGLGFVELILVALFLRRQKAATG